MVRTPRVAITSLIPTGTPASGGSFSPFVANASIEPQDENRAILVVNVQTRDGDAAFGAGDRMVDKFFDQVKEELAGQVTQKASVKAEEASVPVAPPKAVPAEPTLTAASVPAPGGPALGTVIL